MIDLGRKDSCCEVSPCSPCAPEKPARIDYPRLHITSDKAIKLPDGEFEAVIKCCCKSGEWRENERGEKTCTYTLEVMGIQPKKSSNIDKEEEPDAAAAIMESMKRASSKKIKED